jgi:hypothetical protein
MSTRIAKKIVYGALYALLWLIFFGVIYLLFVRPFTPAPVAACAPGACTPTSTVALSSSIVSTLVTGSGQDTYLVQVVNSNVNYGAALINYAVDFYDASDTILQSIPGQSFIYANQDKYILIPNQSIPQTYDHMAFTITNADWLPSSTIGTDPGVAPGGFALQNVQAITASTTVSVGGQITNTSIASFEQVVIMVLFKDVNGNIVGASQTELNSVEAGESTNFSVIYPNEPGINPELNQIIVYALR